MHDKVLVLHGLVAANCNLFLSNHYTRKIDQHLVLVSQHLPTFSTCFWYNDENDFSANKPPCRTCQLFKFALVPYTSLPWFLKSLLTIDYYILKAIN